MGNYFKKKSKCYIKQERETQWSARADAIEVVYKEYFELVNVLEEINKPDVFVVLNDIDSTKIDFTKILKEFSKVKPRKKTLY